jgi:hypothetical protein
MVVSAPVVSRQERVARDAEATAVQVMGQMNLLSWALVEMMVEVLEAEAWGPGGGLRSPEHWLAWRTGLEPIFTPPTGERLEARWFSWN